jgi:predicted AlkP superfamily pyrophosphatase or phosphodiesterase
MKRNVILFLSIIKYCFTEKTLLISADGFRWDYYGKYPTPSLDRIAKGGFRVKNLINTYATVTFPNHYTLVTGLYEESHGIIDNEMYDPVFNETFSMSTVDPKWWAEAEPVWVTAEKSGVKTVCVNWVGCSVPHGDGIRPTYWNNYDGSLTYERRVEKIVEHLIEGDAHLGLLYFENPDHVCHMYGPDSDELRNAVAEVDSAIGYLLEKVDIREVNVIFTSDHGGYGVAKDRIVVLEDYSSDDFRLAASGAVAHVWPLREGQKLSLLEAFQAINPEQASCFLKENLPPTLHYTHNRRIAPIVCMAELGWTVVKSQKDKQDFRLNGSHGYDSTEDDDSPMRPVFLATGPGLVRIDSYEPLPPFENIHVFAIVASLVGIPREAWPPVNGTLERIEHLLQHTSSNRESVIAPFLLGATYTFGLGLMVI